MKANLEWEPLEVRRKTARVSIFHQALQGRLAIPMQNVLRPAQRSSRHVKYTQIQTNKNCYKYSYIPKTLVDWNAIPEHITSIEDKDKFKAAVTQYYANTK